VVGARTAAFGGQDFLAADFLVVDFLAGAFFAAVVFFAVVFFAGADFVAVAFFAGAAFFVEAGFVAVLFLAVVFLAGLDFFAGADLVAVDFVAVFFAGALPAAALAVPEAAVIVSFGSFFAPETTAFSSAPGLNLGTAVFFALIRSPVRGLRTQRASRTRFSKEPNPVMATFSPFATSRVMVSTTDSSAWAAALRLPS
jgi:hypothetical protein